MSPMNSLSFLYCLSVILSSIVCKSIKTQQINVLKPRQDVLEELQVEGIEQANKIIIFENYYKKDLKTIVYLF